MQYTQKLYYISLSNNELCLSNETKEFVFKKAH